MTKILNNLIKKNIQKLITGNFEKPLDNETTKQLMHEIMGEITQ